MRRLWEVLGWLCIAVTLLGGCYGGETAVGSNKIPTPTPSEALRRDAQEYAKQFGVSETEAMQRLQYQDKIGDLNAALLANESETFGGLWIEHEPQYRVIVRFTRNGKRTIRPYLEGKSFAHLVEVREARYTLAELETIQAQAIRELGKLDFDVACLLSVRDNRIEVPVSDQAWFESELRRVGAQLPEGVELVVIEGGSTARDKDLLLKPPVPGIAFPRQKPVEGMRTSMLAELIGTLQHQDGCLRVQSLHGGEDVLPIWPPEFTLRVEGEQVLVIDGNGQVAARAGQEVYMGGGYVAVTDEWVLGQIPQVCRGEYFVVGDTVRPNLRQDSDLFGLDMITTAERTVLFLHHKPALDAGLEEAESLAGELVAYDYRRCLHLQQAERGQLTLFWPPDWSARLEGELVMVVDGTGKTVAQVGDRVHLRGRAVPHTWESEVYRRLVGEMPGDCIGASWVVDGVE